MKPTVREQAVFAAALLRSGREERAAFLTSACGPDAALRKRVEALLQASEAAGEFLEESPFGLGETVETTLDPSELSEMAGDRIGRYKLLEKIGEGGCGVVYLAEQEEPVRRRVAVKVIKLGMDTRTVIARFEAERQALALMDHPHIAKVFDGGATPTGRPYFVMELVRGVRLTEFCDAAQLSTEARLRLFVQVCQAVEHAHQKGIIHRDLKPSNLLVTVNDGVPVPKVIDFGIAKATGQRLTDKTLFTQFHAFIGTPAYTSPEQAEMSSVDVDTRSDIYSLGVLLYELLTGRTPFDGEALLRAGLDELRRVIRDTQPSRPSDHLDTLGLAEATELSGKRRINVQELVTDVRGDLDWIVMKCLEKDRARRYETASALAADIQRHLAHVPIAARPPSRRYLLQKFAQRNRGPLVATTLVFAALLVSLLTLATSYARIRGERNQKDEALRERSAALATARTSEYQAREQLFASLQSQAQARRNSRQMGQRLESLAALTEAVRIRPTPEVRDGAIAALALPDVQLGPSWAGWGPQEKCLAYDSRNHRYARMDLSGAISIRSVADDRELQRLVPNPSTAAAAHGLLRFSPDGRWLAWLSDGARLDVWRWESGQAAFQGPFMDCSSIAFSPDSRRLALAQDTTIRCLDLGTGEELRHWEAPDSVYHLEFHPNSRQLAAGFQSDTTVMVYDSDTGTRLVHLPTEGSSQNLVAWHPDGELLACGGAKPPIQVWNVMTRRQVATLEGHAGPVTHLSFHPRGDLLSVLAIDGILRLWHPSPGRSLMQLPLSGWVAFSGGDRWAGVISPSPGQAQLWGMVLSEEYQTYLNPFARSENELREGDLSPDGTLLALGTTDGVWIWDTTQGRVIAWLRIGDTFSVSFRADGRELLTSGPADGLQRWPMESNPASGGGLRFGPPQRIPLPFGSGRITRAEGSRNLAVADEGSWQVALVDLATDRLRSPLLSHEFACFLALHPDGDRLATSGWHTESVKLWDGPRGQLLKEWQVGKQSRAFFTPNGRELIVARAHDFTFHDLATLKESRRLARDRSLYPGCVAFTAEGKLMALELAPGVIHLQEVSSGRTVARLEDPHGDRSSWMEFTPDGTQLVVVAGFTGAIHRWDLRALRTRLKAMNLDWDWPEFPRLVASSTQASPAQPPRRMQIVVATPPAVPAPTLNP